MYARVPSVPHVPPVPPCIPQCPHVSHVSPMSPMCPQHLHPTPTSPNVHALWQEVPGLFLASWDIPLVALCSSGRQKNRGGGGKTLNTGGTPTVWQTGRGKSILPPLHFWDPANGTEDTILLHGMRPHPGIWAPLHGIRIPPLNGLRTPTCNRFTFLELKTFPMDWDTRPLLPWDWGTHHWTGHPPPHKTEYPLKVGHLPHVTGHRAPSAPAPPSPGTPRGPLELRVALSKVATKPTCVDRGPQGCQGPTWGSLRAGGPKRDPRAGNLLTEEWRRMHWQCRWWHHFAALDSSSH